MRNAPDPSGPTRFFRGDALQHLAEPPTLTRIHPAELMGDVFQGAQRRMRVMPHLDEILQGRHRRQQGSDHCVSLNHGFAH